MTRILLCGQFAFLGVILLLAPNMTRRSLLFAVPVAEDFGKQRKRARRLACFAGSWQFRACWVYWRSRP